MPDTSGNTSSTSGSWVWAALGYATQGWPVIPLHHPIFNGDTTSCSCGRTACFVAGCQERDHCHSAGKHPRTEHGLEDATTDARTIRAWAEQWPQSNLAIITGAASRTVVLDIDPRHGGLASLVELGLPEVPGPEWGTERIQRTGSGGYHAVYQHPDRLTRNRVGLRPGLDVRADGGYIVVAPSIHAATGEAYEWIIRGSTGIPPGWFADLLVERERAPRLPDIIGEGSRDATLTSLAGSMRGRGASEGAILAALRAENAGGRVQPPLDDFDLRRIANSAGTWEPGDGPQPTFTDKGNGERLISKFGSDLRFVHEWGRWLIWNSRYWRVDATGEIMRRAKLTSVAILEEARDIDDEQQRERITKWSMTSQNASRLDAMIKMAQSEAEVALSSQQLDRHPMKLNALNASIDLRTGLQSPHRKSDLLTKCVNTVYDPAARCPAWLSFLDRIFDGKRDMIEFIQRVVGYSLTGSVSEQKLFFFFGTGANGKTVFVEVIRALLGEYAQVAEFSTFLHREQDNAARNDLARLPGARLVTATEVNEGKRLNEALIKSITGGDKITARFLFHELFDFFPEFKLVLVGNHKPPIRGNDEGFWRRFVMVPFEVTIPIAERKPLAEMVGSLTDELPGILAWAVQGCLEWQKNGLDEPAEVLAATQSYRDDMDDLLTFFSERCRVVASASVSAADLYRSYCEWAEANGARALSMKVFGLRVAEKGVVKERNSKGVVYRGIDVRKDAARVTGNHPPI